MKASGSSVTDTGLVVLTLGCAAVILTILFGGPTEVIQGIESLLRSALDAATDMIRRS